MNILVAFIFSIINIIFIIFLIIIADREDKKDKLGLIIFLMLIYIITIAILTTFSIVDKNEIEPIEVYRGNTTLQITYKDNVPIDSVVVYKNK